MPSGSRRPRRAPPPARGACAAWCGACGADALAPAQLCTVTERRRLPQALTLAASFTRWHPDGAALVVVADEDGEPPAAAVPDAIRVVAARAAIGPVADVLAGVHTGAELAEALVP